MGLVLQAVVAHLEASHVQSLPVLSEELEKVKTIENGVMSWHETVEAYIEGSHPENTPPRGGRQRGAALERPPPYADGSLGNSISSREARHDS